MDIDEDNEKIKDLSKYKQLKKIKLLLSDISDIIKIINVALFGLNKYAHYVAVRKVATAMIELKTTLIQREKSYKEILDGVEGKTKE